MRTIKFRGLEANPYCEELRTFLYGTPLFITNEENYILPNFWDYEGLNKFKVLKKTQLTLKIEKLLFNLSIDILSLMKLNLHIQTII